MPPHPRMVTAQMLLARLLLTAFVAEPYGSQLVRWKQQLHVQFLRPHWLWVELEEDIGYLRARDLSLDAEMDRPFLELRYPVVGSLRTHGLVFELCNPIEPWNVLGEEPTPSIARYVDASMKRISRSASRRSNRSDSSCSCSSTATSFRCAADGTATNSLSGSASARGRHHTAATPTAGSTSAALRSAPSSVGAELARASVSWVAP